MITAAHPWALSFGRGCSRRALWNHKPQNPFNELFLLNNLWQLLRCLACFWWLTTFTAQLALKTVLQSSIIYEYDRLWNVSCRFEISEFISFEFPELEADRWEMMASVTPPNVLVWSCHGEGRTDWRSAARQAVWPYIANGMEWSQWFQLLPSKYGHAETAFTRLVTLQISRLKLWIWDCSLPR